MPKNRALRLLYPAVVVCSLVSMGRNVYRRRLDAALLLAVHGRNVTAVRALLARGADANTGLSSSNPIAPTLDTVFLHGYNPGNRLSEQEEDIICLLVAHGAKFNAEAHSASYLYFACACGSVKVARCLLEHGADMKFEETRAMPPERGVITYYNLNRPDEAQYWRTTAGQERLRACRELIQLLKAHGGHLTLWQAAQLNDISGLRAALDAGTAINTREPNIEKTVTGVPIEGSTALRLAAEAGHIEAVRFLLAHHADVNSPSAQGHTPLNSARKYRHPDVATLLQQAGGKDE